MTCKPCKTMPVLKHSVTIQRPNGTADAAGHIDTSDNDNWQDVASRRCEIKTRGGRESYQFNQVQAEISHLIEMRSDSVTRAIQPDWRLKFGNRYFDIRAAYDVDEMRESVRCECTEQK